MRRYILILVFASCDRASPLGTFSRDDLAKWTTDCETSIVEENPHDSASPGPIMRDGGRAFVRATRRFRCPPPGWAIYTDAKSRIVGLCIDDDWNSRKNQGVWIAATDRARSLITAHWGVERAGEMLKGTAGDDCELTGSVPIASGMLRFGMTQLVYPEPTYSNYMCCWELADD